MIFENKKEYDELVNDVTQSLETLGEKDKNPQPKEGFSGEIQPENYKPPSDGHSDSKKDPKMSSKKDDNPLIEDLEDRLCKVLLELQAQGGVTPVPRPLGTSKGKESPRSLTTPSKAARHAISPHNPGGKVEKKAEEEVRSELEEDDLEKLDPKVKEMEEKGRELNQRSSETQSPTSGSGLVF